MTKQQLQNLQAEMYQIAVQWCDVDPPSDDYSTCHNSFLAAAEAAYLRARRENLEARVPEPDPLWVPRNEGYWLYRLYDAHDRLLYVGVTTKPVARFSRHKKRWGELIARVDWAALPDAAAMLNAERQAIAAELPALNKALV